MQPRQLRHLSWVAAGALLPIGAAMGCPVLQDGENLMPGNSDFQFSGAGTLMVSIESVLTGTTISDTEFSVYAAPNYVGSGNFIGELVGSGEISIPVIPDTKYHVWFNSAATNASVSGQVVLNFQPNNSPVPLPGSWLLMLSGLSLTVGAHLRFNWMPKPQVHPNRKGHRPAE